MQKLVEGIHRFQQDIFSAQRGMFQGLVDGQAPVALFITCSDSRINPQLLTQTQPGELFILRNAGNLIPPYGVPGSGEAAAIEYAVAALHVKDIVVCGHSHCGAMAGLLDPAAVAELPAVRQWLRCAAATERIIRENYAHLRNRPDRLAATVEENVLVQLEHLRTHPVVAAGLSRGDLKLHGWVYKFETGQVFAFDPEQGQYLPIAQTARHYQEHNLTAAVD